MRIYAVLSMLFLFVHAARAQNGLKQCAEKRNKEIENILKQGKGDDTAILKRFNELNKEWKTCVVGKDMPGFTIKTIAGDILDSDKLRGKVLVINFWFTACVPCIAELPALNRLVNEYDGKNVVFLGITYEKIQDLEKMFFPKYKFDFTIVPDAQAIEDMFGVTDHPVIFVIDQQGKVKIAWAGGVTDERAKTEAYLKAKPIIDELLKGE